MKQVGLIVSVCVLSLLLLSCTSRQEEIAEAFGCASTSEEEAAAIERVIDDYERSNGRYSYACYVESANGDELTFEEALQVVEGGDRVSVAIRLLDEDSFGPEAIELGTFWHEPIALKNLRRLFSQAFDFREIGDPPPRR